jgi:hypothetical protein
VKLNSLRLQRRYDGAALNYFDTNFLPSLSVFHQQQTQRFIHQTPSTSTQTLTSSQSREYSSKTLIQNGIQQLSTPSQRHCTLLSSLILQSANKHAEAKGQRDSFSAQFEPGQPGVDTGANSSIAKENTSPNPLQVVPNSLRTSPDTL